MSDDREPTLRIGNLRHAIPSALPEELVTPLLEAQGLRVERIVSRGHASPPAFWYDQDEHELVFVLQGHARLEVDGQGELDLRSHDFVLLPAHVKHRVTWTCPQQDTIWLAIFYR